MWACPTSGRSRGLGKPGRRRPPSAQTTIGADQRARALFSPARRAAPWKSAGVLRGGRGTDVQRSHRKSNNTTADLHHRSFQ